MDDKTRQKVVAALDAAEAIFNEIENPTMNLGEQHQFAKEKMKAVRAARKAIAKD